MENVQIQTGVKKTSRRSGVSLDKVYAATYQKEGTETAQLRETITNEASYPGKKVGNSMNGSIFDVSEFGFTSQDFISNEERVAWILVPVGTSVEAVAERLKSFPNATLYKVLDNRPILTEDQHYAINNGIRPLDDFANSQVVRYPENHPTQAGNLILDPNGNVQYRAVFFAADTHPDMDNRNTDVTKHYISPEIKAELEGRGADATVIAGQSIV